MCPFDFPWAQVRQDLICPRDSDDTYNVLPSIRPRPEDIVVDKWTWGIFASTDLEQQLRARGVRRLIVIGVATNVCVTNAVFQAVDRFVTSTDTTRTPTNAL